MNRVFTGTYTGTGAAVNVSLGFIPAYVKIFNETDGDDRWEWVKGMTDGHAYQTIGSTGVGTKITSNGVSEYAGSRGSAAKGFTAGTSLSESGKTFRYVAFRED